MPRIPTWDTPQIQDRPLPTPDLRSAATPDLLSKGADAQLQIGAGLSNAGGNLVNISVAEKQKEQAVAKEADRVRAITAQATAKNALADLQDELVTGLNEGRYDKTTVAQLQAEKSKKLIDEAVSGVSPEHQDLVRASLIDDYGRSQREMRKVVSFKDKQDIGAGIIGYMEEMQRYAQRGDDQRKEAMNNVETFLQSAGPQAGMNAEAIAKSVQGFKENVTLALLDKNISQNARNGNALAQIQKDITADKFPELDPMKRNFLESKIQRNQEFLMRQAEINDRRNLTNLGIMEKRLAWYVENGRDIPASERATVEKASKGTVFDGTAQMIIAEQKSVAELQKMTPQQMEAKIKEIESSYGETPSREQIIHLEKLKRFANNSIKLLNESPLDYAVTREGAKIEPLNFSNPQEMAANLAQRTAILTEQNNRTGAMPKGLFPQEAIALSNVLKNGPVEQKHLLLQQLYQGFNNDKVFRATMQQIAPDNPVAAAAGIAASRGLESTKDRSVADMMLRGQEILSPNKKEDGKPGKGGLLPMPEEKLLMEGFSNYEKNAFSGKEQTRNVFYQSAKSIYAAKSVEEVDFSGIFNSKRWMKP